VWNVPNYRHLWLCILLEFENCDAFGMDG